MKKQNAKQKNVKFGSGGVIYDQNAAQRSLYVLLSDIHWHWV